MIPSTYVQFADVGWRTGTCMPVQIIEEKAAPYRPFCMQHTDRVVCQRLAMAATYTTAIQLITMSGAFASH